MYLLYVYVCVCVSDALHRAACALWSHVWHQPAIHPMTLHQSQLSWAIWDVILDDRGCCDRSDDRAAAFRILDAVQKNENVGLPV